MRKKRFLSLALASWMSLSLLSTTMGINVKAEENATEDATVVETASYTDAIETGTEETGESAKLEEVDDAQEESATEELQLVEEEVDVQWEGLPGVEVNEENFPDDTLRNYIKARYLVYGKIWPSENKELSIDDSLCSTTYSGKVKDIKDFTGIEHFSEIERLVIDNGANIKTLDLSCFHNLKIVEISNNNIEKIIGVGESVERIDISNSNVKMIDLSKAYNLNYLQASNNCLSELDVKNCKKLEYFFAKGNELESLELSGLTELIWLSASNNNISEIDISDCNKLQVVYLADNKLSNIDLSNKKDLQELDVKNNNLSTLGFDSNLCFLYCGGNKLTNLDLRGQTNLIILSCQNNDLTSLNVDDCSELYRLNCSNNKISNLNISNNLILLELNVGNNCITNLDCTKNTALRRVNIAYNSIPYLDLRNINYDDDPQDSIMIHTINDSTLNVYVNNNCKERVAAQGILSDDNGEKYPDYSNATIIELDPSAPIPETVIPPVTVTYNTHIQTYGWRAASVNGATSGTSGESKRLEAIKINVSGVENLGVTYQTHVQSYGWQNWKTDGDISGTSGEAKRLEAIRIKLTGANADKYDIFYRVHAQSYGWLGWAKNGASAGTAGQSLRLEAIQIVVLPKGETPTEVCNAPSFIEIGKKASNADNAGMVNYMTHVQSYGDQSYVSDGSISGTSGESKRLEAIRIKLNNDLTGVTGGITYQTHIQKIGWQDWKSDGEMSGTSGKSYRLEAIRIKLTGEMEKKYDVYYRVHSQRYGWLGWAKNGEEAGTSGQSLRLEGIQIVLVPKGGAAPGSTSGSYIQK